MFRISIWTLHESLLILQDQTKVQKRKIKEKNKMLSNVSITYIFSFNMVITLLCELERLYTTPMWQVFLPTKSTRWAASSFPYIVGVPIIWICKWVSRVRIIHLIKYTSNYNSQKYIGSMRRVMMLVQTPSLICINLIKSTMEYQIGTLQESLVVALTTMLWDEHEFGLQFAININIMVRY